MSDELPAWLPAERSERITNFVLACIAITVLAVAIYLSPSQDGHGTHQQLGLPPCNFLQATGYPCLSCGMTTAFSHAVRGQFVSSFVVQPFGMLLAVATMLSVPLLLWSSIRGWSLGERFARVNWRIWGPLLLVALIGAWGYKILVIRLGA